MEVFLISHNSYGEQYEFCASVEPHEAAEFARTLVLVETDCLPLDSCTGQLVGCLNLHVTSALCNALKTRRMA